LDEYFYGNGATLVEWAELIEDLLPAERLAIRIEHSGGDGRIVRLLPYGAPYTEWCRQLKEIGLIQ